MLGYIGMDEDKTVILDTDVTDIGDVHAPKEVDELLDPFRVLCQLADQILLTDVRNAHGQKVQ